MKSCLTSYGLSRTQMACVAHQQPSYWQILARWIDNRESAITLERNIAVKDFIIQVALVTIFKSLIFLYETRYVIDKLFSSFCSA